MYRLATIHFLTDRLTGGQTEYGQTDGRQHNANSQSYDVTQQQYDDTIG